MYNVTVCIPHFRNKMIDIWNLGVCSVLNHNVYSVISRIHMHAIIKMTKKTQIYLKLKSKENKKGAKCDLKFDKTKMKMKINK
jgi:hypothetical protein